MKQLELFPQPEPQEEVIYRKSFRHSRTRKIITRKDGGSFRFVIRKKPPSVT